ncbi:MAG: hypothetical protein ABS35_37870 [Kaistia sp. SCN 65-12]|nr:MAG: hypothetical protein ABS35_37870 [Kaistia sp. SCN 65-12]
MDIDAAEVAGIAADEYAPGWSVPFNPGLQRIRKIVDVVDHYPVAPQGPPDHRQKVDQERARITRRRRCQSFGGKGAHAFLIAL